MPEHETFAPAVDPDRAVETLTELVRSPAADAIDAFLVGRTGEYTRFADGRIHQPQDVTEVQVMVRAVVDGHAARASASSLLGAAGAADQAVEMARALRAAAGRPGRVRVADTTDAPLGEPAGWGRAPGPTLVAPSTLELDAAARVRWVREAQATCAQHGGWVAGMLGRAWTQLAVATSAGVAQHVAATEASLGCTVGVGDGTSHVTDLSRVASRLGLDTIVPRALSQAAAGAGREVLAPGRYTVVLGPEATAELLEFLPATGFSGELAAAGVGLCARRAGDRVATDLVTVADDALADVGLPIHVDIEGVPKQRVAFLDRGVVGRPVTDLATATQLGTRSTGHAHIAREEAPATCAANLVMSAGDLTEDDLVAGVGSGVYIQRFWYTRLVDPTTGTITGVTRDACFEIRDGRLTRPLAGMRFTESVLDLLAGVDGVGCERRTAPLMNVFNGSSTAPAIRTHRMRLGAAPATSEGRR